MLVALLIAGIAQGALADVVLLRNGSIIVGEPHATADRVRVVQNDGELTLRSQEVATIVPTLPEAYDWLRAQQATGARSAEESLDLAEWCLRNDLMKEASRELLEAQMIAPHSERLRLLQRRLLMLDEESTTPAESSATFSQPTPMAASEHANGTAGSLQLPPDGLQHFSRRIQPLLVNNCTGGGCHTSQDSGAFALDRTLLYGYADARSTRSNLEAVLSAIDVTDPSASALLAAVQGAHHGAEPLRGPRRDELLGRLEQWVTLVALSNGWQEAKPQASPIDATAGHGAVAQAAYEEPVEVAETPIEAPPAPVIQRGGLLRAVEPRDEFDPEIFNRRHRRPEDDLPETDVQP